MSGIYDNWERLVAAVLKREQIWQLCHAHSRSSSFSSISSEFDPSSSSRFDENSKHEWIEQYEPWVSVTFEVSGDGSINVKLARFSRKTFSQKEAENWWLNNGDKLYKKYNHLYELAQLGRFSIWDQAGSASSVSEESKELGGPGRNEQPLTQTTFDENMKSRNLEVVATASQIGDEWVETYEPGVRVILRALRDGTRNIIRIRFSRTRFRVHEAKAWWLENEEKVYKKYNFVWP